jgi:hypothetical protein
MSTAPDDVKAGILAEIDGWLGATAPAGIAP